MSTIEEQHLLLPTRNEKYWYLTIDENTALERYYLYTEIIVPVYKDKSGNKYDNHNLYIRFMNTDFSTIPSTDYTNLDKYTHSKFNIEFDAPLGTKQYYKIAYDTCDFLDNKHYNNNFEEEFPNSNINDDFRVISLIVLPELNKPDATIEDKTITDYATLLVLVNGRQITFSPNTVAFPLYKFYNGDNAISQIVVETVFPDNSEYKQIPFIIWNTTYDKFVYQDLANMCYKEHTKNIKTINNLKYPFLDSYFKVLVPKDKPSSNYLYSIGNYKYKIPVDTSKKGFIFYKAFKMTKNTTSFNYPIKINLVNLTDDSYNVFNEDYAEEYSFLNITESIQEQIVKTINYNINYTEKEKYLICYLRVTDDNQVMIGYGSTTDINTNFGPTQETVNISNDNNYVLQIKAEGTNTYNDDNVHIEDISYSGNIPYPRDITTEEKNSLFMSPNNYHWKSLWKYNRTIEYSSPLLDNPVILPLNVFTDDENENMFIEFIVNSGSDAHFGVDLFDTCNIEQDSSDINITPSGALFPVNGVSNVYYEGTVRLNVVSNSKSVYFSQDPQGTTYPVSVCIYYNSATKKLITKRSDESDSKEITEISKDVLRNISCHIPGTGSITINFGPTSDYFQDYIDEILDQDNKPTQEIQIINKNIVKDLQFYNISDIIGVTPTPDPTYTYAAIPSGTLITGKDYNTRLGEIKEETLRIYCSHEYSNNNSVIYISNNDNFDMRSPVNILSILAVRAKATATFTLPPDPNLETYMNTILEKYVEGFYTYNVTVNCGSQRVIDGGTRARVDEFKIQKINENQFELIMVCDYVGSNNSATFQKDHSYQFDSYSTISYSYSDFGEDIYLTLMKSTVTTKLEFTIIGDYNGGGEQ